MRIRALDAVPFPFELEDGNPVGRPGVPPVSGQLAVFPQGVPDGEKAMISDEVATALFVASLPERREVRRHLTGQIGREVVQPAAVECQETGQLAPAAVRFVPGIEPFDRPDRVRPHHEAIGVIDDQLAPFRQQHTVFVDHRVAAVPPGIGSWSPAAR